VKWLPYENLSNGKAEDICSFTCMLHIYHVFVLFIYREMLPLFRFLVTWFNRLYSSFISGMLQPDWGIYDFPLYASISPENSSIGHGHLPNDYSMILPFDIYIV